ncbi:MAG: site-specific DNA-methyltransferase [Clostridia bacterium]|nr:site-specific DNA-methyltransferase [Clostridia bacterium]
MSLIEDLAKVMSESIEKYQIKEDKVINVGDGNLLHCGDNEEFMKALINGDMKGKIQMIYIDPPFFSKADYKARVVEDGEAVKIHAYADKWKNGLGGYLAMLGERLFLMKDLLAGDGLIWVHLDWHAVHYVKVIMDEIFGADCFVNEIVWTYKSGGASKKRFSLKHDTILVYSKTNKYKFFVQKEKSYNRQFKPYHFKGVEEFQDEIGWYTMVNMKDVWNIDMVGRTSAERTGYATQKPEKLIERMIKCCTEEGDICADFFCGSGTLPVVAGKLGRRYIACDSSQLACDMARERLEKEGLRVRLD